MTASPDPGWRWLARLILGPAVWAVAFTAAYALHGWACARPEVPPGTRPVLLALWAAALGLLAFALARSPRGAARETRLPRLGLWIGLAATGITLAPLVLIGMC